MKTVFIIFVLLIGWSVYVAVEIDPKRPDYCFDSNGDYHIMESELCNY